MSNGRVRVGTYDGVEFLIDRVDRDLIQTDDVLLSLDDLRWLMICALPTLLTRQHDRPGQEELPLQPKEETA
jgi:hypothetical protein